MKDRKLIRIRVAQRRSNNNVKRRLRKIEKRRKGHIAYLKLKRLYTLFSESEIFFKFLPSNLSYLLQTEDTQFSAVHLYSLPDNLNGVFTIPECFSIFDNADESYDFISSLLKSLVFQRNRDIIIDYKKCKAVDLGTQVFLDIIIKDIISYFKKLRRLSFPVYVKGVRGINIYNDDVRKLLFSVGSPAIHSNTQIQFADIVSYPLCIHDREKLLNDKKKIQAQKDIDTTALVDYVVESLKRIDKELTPESLDDLCVIIGEMLINAEEHSTTKYRFSIGYFQEYAGDKHYGVFKLVILNFGKTIYQKFSDPDCGNPEIVEKMKSLSSQYNLKRLFKRRVFDEECLWTIYALQEGVTSIGPDKYKKRGNGSIQFIDRFFNLKGNNNVDNLSKMYIQSGKTQILFDGQYRIVERTIGSDKFKVMTFNESGNIEEPPDVKYVKRVANHFPGTIISTKILINEDDIQSYEKHN